MGEFEWKIYRKFDSKYRRKFVIELYYNKQIINQGRLMAPFGWLLRWRLERRKRLLMKQAEVMIDASKLIVACEK